RALTRAGRRRRSAPGTADADGALLHLALAEALAAVPDLVDRRQAPAALLAARPLAAWCLVEDAVGDHLDDAGPSIDDAGGSIDDAGRNIDVQRRSDGRAHVVVHRFRRRTEGPRTLPARGGPSGFRAGDGSAA